MQCRLTHEWDLVSKVVGDFFYLTDFESRRKLPSLFLQSCISNFSPLSSPFHHRVTVYNSVSLKNVVAEVATRMPRPATAVVAASRWCTDDNLDAVAAGWKLREKAPIAPIPRHSYHWEYLALIVPSTALILTECETCPIQSLALELSAWKKENRI